MRRMSAARAELLPLPAPPSRPIETGVSAPLCSASSARRASAGESASGAPIVSAAKTLWRDVDAATCGSRETGGGGGGGGRAGNSAKDGWMRRSVVSVSLTFRSLARRPALKPIRDAPNFPLWQCLPRRASCGSRSPAICLLGKMLYQTAAMPDLLLELFSEEIPARMQARAAADLKRLVTDALIERRLVYEGAAAFATPRRLALHVAGIPVRQPDTREEKKGPRVGAPEAAVQGFLKSAGLASIADATIVKDAKKGEFYTAVIERPGQTTLDVLGEILPAIIRAFPWPKSMRWGAPSTRPDSLRWVRPLHSIVATFGPETE